MQAPPSGIGQREIAGTANVHGGKAGACSALLGFGADVPDIVAERRCQQRPRPLHQARAAPQEQPVGDADRGQDHRHCMTNIMVSGIARAIAGESTGKQLDYIDRDCLDFIPASASYQNKKILLASAITASGFSPSTSLASCTEPESPIAVASIPTFRRYHRNDSKPALNLGGDNSPDAGSIM